jgi:release factor glutamine methyltransferase
MNIDGLIAAATLELAEAGIEDAELDARLLFQHLTAMTRTQLVLRGRQAVDQYTAEQYRHLITQRSHRIPLHYLTGFREFWSMDFVVSPAVLIPRPETEFLLEQVLAVCSSGSEVRRILDVCTGSGVIAVVLARELDSTVTAVDVSAAALAVAAQNLSRHQVADRVDLVCSDLFDALDSKKKFELIVSNPPYIAEEQIDQLEPEVGVAEPFLALSGGPGGLQIIERIAIEAEKFLQPGGWIFLEIGADQKNAVVRLFEAPERSYDEVKVINDWAGRPRVLQARYIPADAPIGVP